MQKAYPGLYVLTDAPQSDARHRPGALSRRGRRPGGAGPGARICAGRRSRPLSSPPVPPGSPTPHPKSWGALAHGAAGEAERFGLGGACAAYKPIAKSGTIRIGSGRHGSPAAHVSDWNRPCCWRCATALTLHAARPFYPADVRAALEEISGGRVLVTTPVHLRALLADSVQLPPLELIVCATAPLSAEMAAQAEARYGAPLHEVYGFTEAGMVATRRTVDGPPWHTLPGVRLRRQDETVCGRTAGTWRPKWPFTDVVEVRDAETLRAARAQCRSGQHRRQAHFACVTSITT